MKVVQTGSTIRLYGDDLVTSDALAAGVYRIEFNPHSGFYLECYADTIEINEKIYGVHHEKVNKVLNAFNKIERNLGVILSGDKGIGKSIFTKLLIQKAVAENYAVILVDSYIQGIASYIQSIDQNILVIFDEYDKTFGRSNREEIGRSDPQTEMLTLFDGLSTGKKLFVITCNDTYDLSEYLLNRPGRFHYHFRFNYPSREDIEEYLKDHLPEEQYSEISKVVGFASKTNINYDCLRAIAFELSLGSNFSEAIKDLNIMNIDKTSFNVTAVFKNGKTLTCIDYIDLFSTNHAFIDLEDENARDIASVRFIPSLGQFSLPHNGYIYSPQMVTLRPFSYDWDRIPDVSDQERFDEFMKNNELLYILISKTQQKSMHFLV